MSDNSETGPMEASEDEAMQAARMATTTTRVPETMTQRQIFESWYVREGLIDEAPLGSRLCHQLWSAWKAALDQDPSALPRGTGRTTSAMLAAPIGAYYVSCSDRVASHYDLQLARRLNRTDLRIIAPGQMHERLRGLAHDATVILDHDFEARTQDQKYMLWALGVRGNLKATP